MGFILCKIWIVSWFWNKLYKSAKLEGNLSKKWKNKTWKWKANSSLLWTILNLDGLFSAWLREVRLHGVHHIVCFMILLFMHKVFPRPLYFGWCILPRTCLSFIEIAKNFIVQNKVQIWRFVFVACCKSWGFYGLVSSKFGMEPFFFFIFIFKHLSYNRCLKLLQMVGWALSCGL